MVFSEHFPPFRLRWPLRAYRGQKISVLDVGCGCDSPTITRRWFPDCEYHGIDISDAGHSARDRAALDVFYQLDLTSSDLRQVPDDHFDAVFFAHVIEHLPNGLSVLDRLCEKVKPGGKLYVEFPSRRSLRLPSGINTLNFFDDPTHVRFYTLEEVVNRLLGSKMRILRCGTRRDVVRMALSVASIPLQLRTVLEHRKLHARGLWDLLGFAEYVYAERPVT